jgi:hypothetical protein
MAIEARLYHEPELSSPVEECLPGGRLNPAAIGWSRHPSLIANLPDSLSRKKKWNYWAVTSEALLFSATNANMERAGTAGAYLFDRRTRRFASIGARCHEARW